MHILFFIDTWGLIGGTERHAAVVVPALLERGHRVTVLCRENQDPDFVQRPQGAAEASLEILEMPEVAGLEMWKPSVRDLHRQLRRLKPDVAFLSASRNVDAMECLADVMPVVRYVHDHTLFCPSHNKYREDGELCSDPMGLVCLERYWTKGGCVCFKQDRHYNRLLQPLREMQLKLRELEVAKRCAKVLTNSHYMRKELLQVGFLPERTDVLYYFTQSNTPAQPAGPLPDETEAFLAQTGVPLVFTPARLTLPDKGVDYLLTAFHYLGRPFKAVIAGSGPDEDWLRQKARDEGVADSVHFTSWLGSTGIEALYERCDFVVCPSIWNEPFGLVGIEAMAHQKPIVAFRVGGIPEWLEDGVNGYLCERKDPVGMMRAIEKLLDDDGERRAMGQRGHELMHERFPRQAHVDRLETILADAAG